MSHNNRALMPTRATISQQQVMQCAAREQACGPPITRANYLVAKQLNAPAIARAYIYLLAASYIYNARPPSTKLDNRADGDIVHLHPIRG